MGMDWLAHHRLKLIAGGASLALHAFMAAGIVQLKIVPEPEGLTVPITLELVPEPAETAETEAEIIQPIDPVPASQRPEPELPATPEPEGPVEPDPLPLPDPVTPPNLRNNIPDTIMTEDAKPGETADLILQSEPPETAPTPPASDPNPYALRSQAERDAEAARIRDLLARPTAEWLEGIDLSARPDTIIDIYNFGPADTLREKFIRFERCLALTLTPPRICNTPEGRELRSFIFEEGEKLIEAGVFAGWDVIYGGDFLQGSNFDQLERAYNAYLNSDAKAPVGGEALTVKSSSIGDEGLVSERPGLDCHLSSSSGFC